MNINAKKINIILTTIFCEAVVNLDELRLNF